MTINKFLTPKNNVAFQKFFSEESNHNLIITFFNDVLAPHGSMEVSEVILCTSVPSLVTQGKKQAVLDILCKATTGEEIIIQMQMIPSNKFANSIEYHAHKTYADQHDIEERAIHQLRPVFSIAICDCILFPEKDTYISYHTLQNVEEKQHEIFGLYFTVIELPKFSQKGISQLTTMVEKWCYFFQYSQEVSSDMLGAVETLEPVIKRAYERINPENWTEQEFKAYEEEEKVRLATLNG
jgi:predicted transposase/invertase (TIGR01784 family)